jgi:colicin import membrane protein
MSFSEKPGLVLSSTVHVAMLAAAFLSFSQSPKFQDAQETIPVEMVSSDELNQIMRGEKTAKAVQPAQRAEKVAELTETRPLPPTPEAKKDVPTPPPPLKRMPDPGEAEKQEKPDKPEPPKPPERVAALPPPRPQPVTPPTPPVPENPPPEDAEAIQPKPVPRPKTPPPKEQPKEPLKEEAKKPDPKLKLDEVAKLLESDKRKEPPKPASKPKSGEETNETPHKFNIADITKLISHEAPERKASTGAALAQTASLGSPTANAPKMSPSLEAQMEGWFQDRFQSCWTPPITLPGGTKYVPMVRVPLNLDGSLATEPVLVNPPSDPAWRAMAESAVRAVRKCNPLPVPDRFKPYYDDWRGRIVRFTNDDA